jgi:GcrA cell cycle regulator
MNVAYRSNSQYSQDERDSIASWLKEGDSASQIAAKMSAARGVPLSRNAIIGVVRRDKTLNAIGFDRGNQARAGRLKVKLPEAQPTRRASVASPYHLPGKLFLTAIEEQDGVGDRYDMKSLSPRIPSPTVQSQFAAMRFLDCLFDRCRAPLSSDLNEKPGPDMLCCGHLVEPSKAYCAYHQVRLRDRQHSYEAVTA